MSDFQIRDLYKRLEVAAGVSGETSEIRETVSESERDEETSEWAKRTVYEPVSLTVTVVSPSWIFSLLIGRRRTLQLNLLWGCVEIIGHFNCCHRAPLHCCKRYSGIFADNWIAQASETRDKYIIDIGTSSCANIIQHLSHKPVRTICTLLSQYCILSLPLIDLSTNEYMIHCSKP